jgi:hypothetical protein
MTDHERLGSNPQSLGAKAAWQDEDYRIKMKLRDMQLKLDRKIDPQKFKRTGVPNGKTKAQADKLWAKASKLADRFIKIMTDKGELPAVEEDFFLDDNMEKRVIPGTDEGMAREAMREAFKLAVGPSEQKTKISAINTVLAYTKSKPESKSKLTLSKAEDFLDEISGD